MKACGPGPRGLVGSFARADRTMAGLLIALVWGGDQAVKRSTQAAISSTAETASGNAG